MSIYLDLSELTEAEFLAWWDLWLEQAQVTNDLNAHTYSHGVFTSEPRVDARPEGRPGSSGV